MSYTKSVGIMSEENNVQGKYMDNSNTRKDSRKEGLVDCGVRGSQVTKK
jgi:hypothetical protein